MTQEEFYNEYWPRIKGEDVDLRIGIHWIHGIVIIGAEKNGKEVYLKYRTEYDQDKLGPSTIRAIHCIATTTETDLKPNK